jgi:hypothetical protein
MAGDRQQAKELMFVVCSLSYISFYEQFATLLYLKLWAGNKAAHPELHKILMGQW